MQTWNTCANGSVKRIVREQKYWLECEDRNALVWTVIDGREGDVGKESLFYKKKKKKVAQRTGVNALPQNKVLDRCNQSSNYSLKSNLITPLIILLH